MNKTRPDKKKMGRNEEEIESDKTIMTIFDHFDNFFAENSE